MLLLSHHALQRGSSDDLLSQPRVLVDARESGEHDAGYLAVNELWPVNRYALPYVSVVLDQLTHGAPLSVAVGALDRCI